MGVSGSGKSTVGERLARRLGWAFAEGDSLHPPANIAKMHAGKPLDDRDRMPWLAAVSAQMDAWRTDGVNGVITCSALKRRYRDAIMRNRRLVQPIYLEGSEALIGDRLARRRGHFMPATLLESQFAALEPPAFEERAIVASIDKPVDSIVEHIVTALSSRWASIMAPA